MAPRVGGTGEDDGYLVTFTIDVNADAVGVPGLRRRPGRRRPGRANSLCRNGSPAAPTATWAPGSELRRWRDTDTAAEAIGL